MDIEENSLLENDSKKDNSNSNDTEDRTDNKSNDQKEEKEEEIQNLNIQDENSTEKKVDNSNINNSDKANTKNDVKNENENEEGKNEENKNKEKIESENQSPKENNNDNEEINEDQKLNINENIEKNENESNKRRSYKSLKKESSNVNSINDDNEENDEIKENVVINRNLGELEEYDKSIKVIILGDSKVGKSSLINRLMNQKFRELPPTLAIEYHTYTISLNEYTIRMQIWDTAGQEKFNSIVNNYYKGTDVGIFVYSIDKEESFTNMKTWYNKLQENSGENSINILLGNKKDLEEENRQITFEQGENFAVENDFMIFREISCINDEKKEVENINEIFDEIGKYFYDIYRNKRSATFSLDMNYIASESMIALGEQERKKNKHKKCRICCF